MLVNENNMPKSIANAKTIYGFDGHFTSDEDSETDKLFLNVYPLNSEKSIVIDSFGFGTKEQDALKLCDSLMQYDLPHGEPLCPSLFIVSSSLESDTFAPSIKELVYHLEAIKYRPFDKSDYLSKAEQKEVQRLKKIFQEHHNSFAQRK